jgi:N utilization substance protein B
MAGTSAAFRTEYLVPSSDKTGKSQPTGPKPQRGGPISRSQARKRAVEIVYEAAQRGADAVTLLADRVGSVEVDPIADYTITLVEGVTARRESIDELLSEHAQGWTIERMPPVDLAVLRVGVWELLWATDVPDPVAIDEAVGIAKELSTDDSPRFVNGVLGRIGSIAERLRAVL